MLRLPRVSGKEVVRKLKRLEFEVFDQTGSHIYLHKWDKDSWSSRVIVPILGKKILKPKTLKRILEQAVVNLDLFISV